MAPAREKDDVEGKTDRKEEEDKKEERKGGPAGGHPKKEGGGEGGDEIGIEDNSDNEEDAEEEEEEAAEELPQEEAKTIGDVIRVSGKKRKLYHYRSFEYDGNVFELEDFVLLTPEEVDMKPYVAIIKDIEKDENGSVWVTGQWFYRPEEAKKRGGGHWEPRDTRELFFSFHIDQVPAESVMHKCVVHFIPSNKKWPLRSQHPGFVVQMVYDIDDRKLRKFSDKYYEGKGIDHLVQKTLQRIGELPDVEPEDSASNHTDHLLNGMSHRKKQRPSIEASRTDEITLKPAHHSKTESHGNHNTDISEYRTILEHFNALTGDSHRDKWLDKLLQRIEASCNSKEDAVSENQMPKAACSLEKTYPDKESETCNSSKFNGSTIEGNIYWPDAAVRAITALENAVHEALGSDFQKYNQKLRQLVYNLKSKLARRLLNRELDPVIILNMSPDELKNGLTANEGANKEPEETKKLQMTDIRCSRCSDKTVGVAEIIHAGGRGDRYQLECTSCGYNWYASQDAISTLTIEQPNATGSVGTAPLATAKFDAVEKTLSHHRKREQTPADLFRK